MKGIKLIKTLLYDFGKYVLKGDQQQRRYFWKKYKEKLKKLKNKANNKRLSEQKQQMKMNLDNYLGEVKRDDCDTFIFMFSGTTFIQEKRGNRPIRLTNAWLGQGYPVLFSYYRWNKGENIPKNEGNDLYQMPIDMTMEWLDEIIHYNMEGKKKVFIVSFPYPELARYIGQLKQNGWRVLYDVRDNWEEFHKVNMAKWYDESMEKFFVCNCDEVCAVAKPLQQKMQQYTNKKEIKLSPNALDKKFLTYEEPKARCETNEMIIGYVGHLSAGWFDWDVIIEAAKEKGDWQFEIIGHFEPDSLQLPDNIHLLGSKDHQEIKNLTQRWKVALIPFKMGDLSDCVDPIKIYEYLAMGLPVVSFRMPQIHGYPNTYISHRREEFVRVIQKASEEPFDYQLTHEFLEKNTWENRAIEILEWLK